ncbi:MAG: protein-tyrosine-phosphatase, partial [Gammaproteobacteria bacterium]
TGPLWYRGLAQHDEALESAHLDAVLAFYDADHIVIGHTPGWGTVVPRFGGKVILIDSGMSEYYGSHRASLEIDSGEFRTRQGNNLLDLPLGDDDPLPYLQAIAEIEGNVPALLQLIQAYLAGDTATGRTPAQAN